MWNRSRRALPSRLAQPVLQCKTLAAAAAFATATAPTDCFFQRQTVRTFDSERVPRPATVRAIVEATLRAPSSFNMQPWRLLLIDHPELKQQLSDKAMASAGNKSRVLAAPLVTVLLADLECVNDLERIQSLEREAGKPEEYLRAMAVGAPLFAGAGKGVAAAAMEVAGAATATPRPTGPRSWAYKQTGIALGYYLLAAQLYGLGTSPMEGFDRLKVAQVLDIPDRFEPVCIIPTGYKAASAPSGGAAKSARRPASELVSVNTLANPVRWS